MQNEETWWPAPPVKKLLDTETMSECIWLYKPRKTCWKTREGTRKMDNMGQAYGHNMSLCFMHELDRDANSLCGRHCALLNYLLVKQPLSPAPSNMWSPFATPWPTPRSLQTAKSSLWYEVRGLDCLTKAEYPLSVKVGLKSLSTTA